MGLCRRYLEPEYRKTLAQQEMLGYQADVLCLQEVDEKAFTGYFQPHMRHAGTFCRTPVMHPHTPLNVPVMLYFLESPCCLLGYTSACGRCPLLQRMVVIPQHLYEARPAMLASIALAECCHAISGYDGVYTNKAGRVAEGCATFWRRSRYRVAARKDLNMRQIFAAAASPDADAAGRDSDPKDTAGPDGDAQTGPAGPAGRHAKFAPLLRALPRLAMVLQQVGTIAQVLILVPAASHGSTSSAAAHADFNGSAPAGLAHKPNSSAAAPCADANGATGGINSDSSLGGRGAAEDEQALCVVNTHMFYHPWAPHVRILHVAAMMEEAFALAEGTQKAQALASRPALLFCGDLNSDHSWGMPGMRGRGKCVCLVGWRSPVSCHRLRPT